MGIGGLIGAVVTLTLAGRRSLGTVLALGLAGWGIPIVLIGLVPQVALALALMGVIGVANTVIDSTANTLLQRCAPEEAMARVFGVLESVVFAAIGLGSLLAPLLIGGGPHRGGFGSHGIGASRCWRSSCDRLSIGST